MSKRRLIRTSEYPYHVRNRSNNRESFYVPLQELWQIFLSELKEIEIRFGCNIHVFVMMLNHYHLILNTPNENLDQAMMHFNREVARHGNKKASRINHFFGGRYKWSVIDSELYYWNAVKYILRNPVAAGVCSRVEDYAYSTISKKENSKLLMPNFFDEAERTIELDLDWLNEPYSKNQSEAIRKGLRRKRFKLSRNPAGFSGISLYE